MNEEKFRSANFSELVGVTLVACAGLQPGQKFIGAVDDCGHSWLLTSPKTVVGQAEVLVAAGVSQDIMNAPLLEAESTAMIHPSDFATSYITKTTVRLMTAKGALLIKWIGTSGTDEPPAVVALSTTKPLPLPQPLPQPQPAAAPKTPKPASSGQKQKNAAAALAAAKAAAHKAKKLATVAGSAGVELKAASIDATAIAQLATTKVSPFQKIDLSSLTATHDEEQGATPGAANPGFGWGDMLGMVAKNASSVKQVHKKTPSSVLQQVVKDAVQNIATNNVPVSTQKRAGIVAVEKMEPHHRKFFAGGNMKAAAAKVVAVMSPAVGTFDQNWDRLASCGIAPDVEKGATFFRPCPKKPRHGFVDSRVLATKDDVRATYERMVEVDGESEMILMNLIDAQSSAVTTSACVAVGPGNDGATAGKDSVTYDLPSPEVGYGLRKAAKLADGDDGYVESVLDKSGVLWLTQLRGGPKVRSTASRLVPSPVDSVREVVHADGDLLEWEARMAAVTADQRVVVWSPGGSALSHYAVHAILNGVAVSFEKDPPVVGEPFEALPGSEAELDWDREAFVSGVVRAIADASLGHVGKRRSTALMFSAVGIHAALSLRSGASAELLGGACATMMMLSSAASCGEARHNDKLQGAHALSSSRSIVFEQSLLSWEKSRKVLRAALDSFARDPWGGSYGGKKWAYCAAFAIDLEDEIVALCKGAEGASVETVVKLAHRLLNAVHNGGPLLNKFGDPMILNIAAEGSRTFSTLAAIYWHEVTRGPKVADAVFVDKVRAEVLGAAPCPSAAFAFWRRDLGQFVVVGPAADGCDLLHWQRTSELAQCRLLGGHGMVKVQYREDWALVDSDGNPVAEQSSAGAEHTILKNIDVVSEGGDGQKVGPKPGNGSHRSFEVEAPQVAVAMAKYLQEPGGAKVKPEPSLAGSKMLYLRATKAEKVGHAVTIWYGEHSAVVQAPF